MHPIREEEGSVVFSQEQMPRRDILEAQFTALGLNVDEPQFERIFGEISRVQDVCNKVYAHEIKAISEAVLLCPAKGWELGDIEVSIGSETESKAKVVLIDRDGECVSEESGGSSNLDAIVSAIQSVTNVRVFLRELSYCNLSFGANSLGRAHVKVEHHGMHVEAYGCSIDIIEAAAKAFLTAVNIIEDQISQEY